MIRRCLWLAPALLLGLAALASPTDAQAQTRCMNAAQGRIAWDYKGNTRWADKNLLRLCRGASSDEPAKCFRRVMHGNVSWGGSTKWKWENALDLCEQSTDARRTVSCFQRKVKRAGWKSAIAACDERAPRVQTCQATLQGKIAWDDKGSTRWADNNLRRLCGGANARNLAPAQCFDRVMHGGVSWGGSTKWKWENAIDLCERSTDANRTVRCFERAVKRASWQQAIAMCDERTGGRLRVGCKEAVQGKIAWDYKGSRKWAPGNLNRLCRGAQDDEPAKCFQRVMHGRVNWGGGTQWKWENAIDLCEGSRDADRTVRCFQKRVRRGKDWKRAISRCDERGGGRRGRGRR